jgi:hypothetical protein
MALSTLRMETDPLFEMLVPSECQTMDEVQDVIIIVIG